MVDIKTILESTERWVCSFNLWRNTDLECERVIGKSCLFGTE